MSGGDEGRKVVLTEREKAAAKSAGMSPERFAALMEVRTLEDYRRVVAEHGKGRGW